MQKADQTGKVRRGGIRGQIRARGVAETPPLKETRVIFSQEAGADSGITRHAVALISNVFPAIFDASIPGSSAA